MDKREQLAKKKEEARERRRREKQEWESNKKGESRGITE